MESLKQDSCAIGAGFVREDNGLWTVKTRKCIALRATMDTIVFTNTLLSTNVNLWCKMHYNSRSQSVVRGSAP